MSKTDRPPFNELAKPNMSKEAKAVMGEAMQKSCDEQSKLIVGKYGKALRRLVKS